MEYQNPIILSDYSDPDCIRVKDNFYMIASSFNHTPGVPVLKSKNLVDWKIINYVFDKLPWDKYNDVCHGDGAWAPSIRYHNNKFYAFIPFPDEGIYVSECTDIEKGDWSELWPIYKGSGFEDPCPIWLGDKCYVVMGFVKSRIGFNSVLGVFEITPDCKKRLTDYKIIFDGHNTQPTIEGPKFYVHNDYIYILAPAGSVKTGWQTALRSKDIYGPYEEKIVMCQNDSKTNGPHQGALIDLDNNDNYAFVHFQDKGAYGRIVHLQPVKWVNDWPLIGYAKDELIAGSPVLSHEYLVDKKSNYKLPISDDFKDNKLSFMWQTPANKIDGIYELNDGLKLNCLNYKKSANLNLYPYSLLTKLVLSSFNVETKINLNLVNDGDETGLTLMGREYSFISVRRINNKNYLLISKGSFDSDDEIIYKEEFNDNSLVLNIKYKNPDVYYLGVNNKYFKMKFIAKPGRWVGSKYGIFARSIDKDSKGYARFEYFKVRGKKYE